MNTPIIKRYEREEHCRLQAAALFTEDLSISEIARRLKVSRQSVSRWHQIWLAQGAEGLKTHVLPGQHSRLSDPQRQQILAALLEGPQAHGYETPLWTLSRITDLIRKLTGVQYHPGHVWYLLQALGWTCQKPEAQAKERNDAQIAAWLQTEWPRLKKGHKSEGTNWPLSMRVVSRLNPA